MKVMNLGNLGWVVAASFILGGCATPRSRWVKVLPGQTQSEAIEVMGEPLEFLKDGGQDILVWQMDAFEKCAVLFDKAGKVDGKTCKDNAEARARAIAAEEQAAMMYLQIQNRNMQEQQARQNQNYQNYMNNLQNSRPRNTSCTTRFVGNQAYTDCSSGGGIGTSIYR